MKIDLIAVGRLGRTAENSLCGDYLSRASSAGKPLGLGPASLVEVQAKGGSDMEREAEVILSNVPAGAILIACDERGEAMSSRAFAGRIEKWRDGGAPRLCLVIGGADGLSPAIKQRADVLLRLSALTLPHGMVRVLLAEQLYRAVSILNNHPYHRE